MAQPSAVATSDAAGGNTAAAEAYSRPTGMTDKQDEVIQHVAKYVVASCDSAKYQKKLRQKTKYNAYFAFLDPAHPHYGYYEYLLQSYRYWMEQEEAMRQNNVYSATGDVYGADGTGGYASAYDPHSAVAHDGQFGVGSDAIYASAPMAGMGVAYSNYSQNNSYYDGSGGAAQPSASQYAAYGNSSGSAGAHPVAQPSGPAAPAMEEEENDPTAFGTAPPAQADASASRRGGAAAAQAADNDDDDDEEEYEMVLQNGVQTLVPKSKSL